MNSYVEDEINRTDNDPVLKLIVETDLSQDFYGNQHQQAASLL